jgi:hypothetical protein
MKGFLNVLKVVVSLFLVVATYFYIVSPLVIAHMQGQELLPTLLNSLGFTRVEDGKYEFEGIKLPDFITGGDNNDGNNAVIDDVEKFTNKSSSGNNERFQKICTFDEDGYVWCTQKKDYLGFGSGCFLTSYAMVIINAGRHTGTEKNYDPVDVYLANNHGLGYLPPNRIISAYHYKIADGFNYTWKNKSDLIKVSNSQKEAKIKELLKDNPWGVIIGGSYTKSGGGSSTHFIVARLDKNGNLVFDDPAYGSRSSGAKISSISKVWGINSWGNITNLYTITPKLDSNGKWGPGKWENCLKDSKCNVCYKNFNC